MIHIIVPSYNVPGDFIHRCFDSIRKQALEGFNVVIVDDASTHVEYLKHVEYWTQEAEPSWTLVRNEKNMKAPYTLKQGIEASGAADDDVIFLLDGDDFLPSKSLSYVAYVYASYPQLWLTYGSYQPYPDWTTEPRPSEYPTLERWNRDFRTGECRYNHPITFRRFLFDALDDADLQDDHGNWFGDGYDQVIMTPMLEMAGQDHYAFLTETLYYYNPDNPFSEAKLIDNKVMTPRAGTIRDRARKPLLQR